MHQAADALLAALGDVVDRFAGAQRARVDAEERELADKRVGHDLEDQRGKRLVVVGLALDHVLAVIVDVGAFDRRNIERRRQVIDHRVEQVLTPLFLNAVPQITGKIFMRDGRLADAARRSRLR